MLDKSISLYDMIQYNTIYTIYTIYTIDKLYTINYKHKVYVILISFCILQICIIIFIIIIYIFLLSSW